MKTAIVVFDNGFELRTNINGTVKEIEAYYMGRRFNLGNGDKDLMSKAVSVQVLEDEEEDTFDQRAENFY